MASENIKQDYSLCAQFLALLLSCALCCTAHAGDFQRATAAGKVLTLHTSSGKVTRIRERYPIAHPQVSPDGMTAAWLLDNVYLSEYKEVHSGTLVVFRKGKRREIECGVIVRDYWFWKQGEQIAYDCGGRRFAGTETLVDATTLKVIDRFHQADVAVEARPAWSKSADMAND